MWILLEKGRSNSNYKEKLRLVKKTCFTIKIGTNIFLWDIYRQWLVYTLKITLKKRIHVSNNQQGINKLKPNITRLNWTHLLHITCCVQWRLQICERVKPGHYYKHLLHCLEHLLHKLQHLKLQNVLIFCVSTKTLEWYCWSKSLEHPILLTFPE